MRVKFDKALKHIKNGKATGIDVIEREFWKETSEKSKVNYINRLIKDIYDTGELP